MAVGPLEPQFYAELRAAARARPTTACPAQLRRRGAGPELRARCCRRASPPAPGTSGPPSSTGTDACVAPVLSLGEAPAHPHLAARGTFVEQHGVTQPAPAPRFSATPAAARRHRRRCRGEHTKDVLADWDAGDADALLAAGVVRGERGWRRGMRLGTHAAVRRRPAKVVDEVVPAGRPPGSTSLWVAEAYGFDAPTIMGYLAARTERVQIGSAILPIYSRTPALLAQTAAGLDAVSGGRAILGLGASGPQVIEGWHGVRLRPAARPHPRDHRDLPAGVAARAARARRASTRCRCRRSRAPASASR